MTPRMLNPSAWNWGAKSGFFYAGTCFLGLVWTWFRLPEPKGRTYGELDTLFEQRIPARQFSKTIVDPYMSEGARRESVAAHSNEKGVFVGDDKVAVSQVEKTNTNSS